MIPADSRSVAIDLTASDSPEITMLWGPFIPAIATFSSRDIAFNVSRTFDSEAITETISPPAGNFCINLPLAAINFKPSSKLNTPATVAATYSPTL